MCLLFFFLPIHTAEYYSQRTSKPYFPATVLASPTILKSMALRKVCQMQQQQ